MKVEVLASVMNASLRETVQHMNLQSDAVIINQCDRHRRQEGGPTWKKVHWYILY